MRNTISMNDFSAEEVLKILDDAREMKAYTDRKKSVKIHFGDMLAPSVTGLFLERSLRTWGSFARAAKNLGYDSQPILGREQTSLDKGETMANTVRMLVSQQGADILVMRTAWEGAPRFATRVICRMGLNVPVINAGDGSNNHPSQTFLDLMSMREHFGGLGGFTLALCGDISHSRVAHGLLDAARMFGFRVGIFSALETRPPRHWLKGVDVAFESESFEDLKECDILYLFRLQKERISDPNELRRVLGKFQMTPKTLDEYCKTDVRVMHAQPIDMNEGILRLSPGIFQDERIGFIHKQASYGVPVRMALLRWSYQNREEAQREEETGQLTSNVVSEKNIEAYFHELEGRHAKIFRPIRHGTVIDHLPAGSVDFLLPLLKRMERLDGLSIVAASNIDSSRIAGGKKDVLVLENLFLRNEVMATITMLAPQATFNVLREGAMRKLKMPLPKVIPAVFHCPNPLCITNNDPESQTRFSVEESTEEKRVLECRRCERQFTVEEILKKIQL